MGGFGFTSARTLLAILRLSQALARLHQRHEVSRDDITEARRLMTLCRTSILDAGEEVESARQARDPSSTVYNLTLTLTLPLTLTLRRRATPSPPCTTSSASTWTP